MTTNTTITRPTAQMWVGQAIDREIKIALTQAYADYMDTVLGGHSSFASWKQYASDTYGIRTLGIYDLGESSFIIEDEKKYVLFVLKYL